MIIKPRMCDRQENEIFSGVKKLYSFLRKHANISCKTLINPI